MPLTQEEKVLAKHYRVDLGYGYRNIFNVLSTRTGFSGTLDGVKSLVKKIDETGENHVKRTLVSQLQTRQ